ncbi:Uncharacterized protein AC504_1995 [Pseudomonas syringae pv. maculicola]|nr:Uncharacterized protein AC504_1995 [Pseudomonas syringae pv. maculicola]
MILLVLAAGTVQAEKKLEVIDLAPENVSAEDKAAGQRYQAGQGAAAKITPAEAMDFIVRLNSTVEEGHALAKSGTMNGTQSRNQAIALNKLQDEGAKFGTLFAPLAKCNNAAIDAATSWQGLIGKNEKLFVDSHQAYLQASLECIRAAS